MSNETNLDAGASITKVQQLNSQLFFSRMNNSFHMGHPVQQAASLSRAHYRLILYSLMYPHAFHFECLSANLVRPNSVQIAVDSDSNIVFHVKLYKPLASRAL